MAEDHETKEMDEQEDPEYKILEAAMKDNNLDGYNWTVVTSHGWESKLDETWTADHHYQTVRGPTYTLASVFYEGPRQEVLRGTGVFLPHEPTWHIYLTKNERTDVPPIPSK
jgi:hypothetical protein